MKPPIQCQSIKFVNSDLILFDLYLSSSSLLLEEKNRNSNIVCIYGWMFVVYSSKMHAIVWMILNGIILFSHNQHNNFNVTLTLTLTMNTKLIKHRNWALLVATFFSMVAQRLFAFISVFILWRNAICRVNHFMRISKKNSARSIKSNHKIIKCIAIFIIHPYGFNAY